LPALGAVAVVLLASAGALGPAPVLAIEAKLGGGELLSRARRRALPLATPSLAAPDGLATLAEEAEAATPAGGELLRRARRRALPFALASTAASGSLATEATGLMPRLGAELLRRARREAARAMGSPELAPPAAPAPVLGALVLAASALARAAASAAPAPARFEAGTASVGGVEAAAASVRVELAAGFDGATLEAGELSLARGATAPGAGVLPARFARLLPCSPAGIGMPLALAGALAGGGVLPRAGWRVVALAGAARADAGGSLSAALLGAFARPSASAVLGLGATRRDGALWRSSIGPLSVRRLALEGNRASSSESQSDGSGLPSSRLPERRCVPASTAPSSGSGHSSVLFMPGVLSTGGGSSHSKGRHSGDRDTGTCRGTRSG
jgi:hypothetical protein